MQTYLFSDAVNFTLADPQ